jgi:hypothetical protein
MKHVLLSFNLESLKKAFNDIVKFFFPFIGKSLYLVIVKRINHIYQ